MTQIPVPLPGNPSILVRRPDGTLTRLAGGESDAAMIPTDLTTSTSMPGGHRGMSAVLFRSLRSPGVEGPFDDVVVMSDGEVDWEGRIQALPDSTDDGGRLTLTAVGHSAALEDRQDVSRIWVDRELAQWGQASLGRQRGIIDGPYNLLHGSQAWDSDATSSAGPVVRLMRDKGQPAWSSTAGRPAVTATYTGGAPVSSVEWRCRQPRNIADANWTLQTRSWVDAAQTVLAGQTNTVGTALTEGSRITVTAPSPSRSLEQSLRYALAPGGSTENEYGLSLAEVAAYGDLTGIRTARGRSFWGAGQGPLAVYGESVLRAAIAQWAPSLVTDDESVARTPTPIPHLVLREMSTLAQLVDQVNRWIWWDWAVWEDRRFWFHERNAGRSRTWVTSTTEAQITNEGQTTDRMWTGVVCSYRDWAGVEHSIGPPGSTAETINPGLLITDPDSPAVQHGITRWAHLAISQPVDADGALVCGSMWLRDQAAGQRRGSASITGVVKDEHGNWHPVQRVRAGDTLIVRDQPGAPARRIVETSMSYAALRNQLTLDQAAGQLEQLLERIGVSLVGVV